MVGCGQDEMQVFAEALYRYLEPKIDRKLEGCTRKRKGVVTAAPANGKVGVSFPFQNQISVPYVSTLTLAVGDSVWVEAPDGNTINYIVTAKGSYGKA